MNLHTNLDLTGKKRYHSDKREKSYGGGKCRQNGKVVAENATKTVK